MSLGLYLHIPYCFSKCRYCDFYSAPGQRGVPTQYVDALLRELARFAPEAPLHPDTIYFGGGTPSLLSPADAARRQRKGNIELAFEHLSEILIRRVDADGVHRYMERI